MVEADLRTHRVARGATPGPEPGFPRAVGQAHQPIVPGSPLNGPTTSDVIQPP